MIKLTENLLITEEDEDMLVVDFLTDLDFKLDDENNRVLTFFHNQNFYLILYFSAIGDRGFMMFQINKILDNLYELANLKSVLLELLKSGDNVAILKFAVSQIEFIELAGKAAEIFNRK